MAVQFSFNDVKSCVLQAMALVGINGLAFIYDGSYVPLAIGIDALVLGFDLKSMVQSKGTSTN